MPRTPRPASRGTLSYPRTIKPMLATLIGEPFDSPSHLFELKWDGMRAIIRIEDGRVLIQSRNQNDVTHLFPELHQLSHQLSAHRAVLDGEIVSFRDGKPSFAQLQYRLGFNNSLAPAARAAKVGVSFQAFDLLYLDDRTLLREPLELRKELLSQRFSSGDFAQPCEFLLDHGCAFMDAVEEQGLEGMVAKELSSRYLPGKRSSAWQKIKVLRSAEFVIGGYTFGAGYRAQSFGALLLGAYRRDGTLQFVGQVGGGFSDPLLAQIGALLADRHVAASPFADPPQIDRFSFWCWPDLVCKVRYAELTDQGRLRFPIFESLRDDVDPRDCTVESLGPSPASPPLPLGVVP